MCGIVGAICKDSFQIISDNINLLNFRGPDSRGVLKLDNGLTLGATRLAMTDPHQRSNQPYTDTETGNVIVFNGEIYNFNLIKSVLRDRKVNFTTESDTEVVLKSLLNFGVDYISKFEGMFSFAYYDRQNSKLILARDYLGKKPLYYSIGKNSFSFSSQINILKKFNKTVSLNFKSVSTYLGLGYVVDPETMFNEINSIEPGEILIFDIYNHRIEKRERFLPFRISNPTGDEISHILKESVKQRTQGHDNFALSLSGGVDSNLILLNCLELGLSVSPFTVRWLNSDKPRYNIDAQAAIDVAKMLGISLNIIDMPKASQVPTILHDYVKSVSSPNSNPTAISMMFLYSEIQKMNFRLVLTGDGSDEVFGGYHRYQLSNATNIFPKIKNRFLKKLLVEKDMSRVMLPKIAYAISPNNSVESWLYWHLIASNHTVHRIFRGLPEFDVSISSTDLSNVFAKTNNGVRHIMFNDLKTWLPMESNRKLDSISMRYSIEARSPFQAENLIGSGYMAMEKSNFNFVNKELLFKAFPNLYKIPINKNKMGFVSPLGFWLRSNPDLIRDSIQNLNSYFTIDESEIESLTRSPNLGDYNGFKLLWSIIVLERWLALNY